MPSEPRQTMVEILRSAQTAAPDPRLDRVLAGFRRHWLAIARRRYPTLGGDIEDAVQEALVKLVSPDRLASLEDPDRLGAWSHSLFVNTAKDFLRGELRRQQRRKPLAQPAEDGEEAIWDQLPTWEPTPEERAAHRERLEIVVRYAARSEVARLKLFEDLPDKEIATRTNLTRDGVAGKLKRFRHTLREVLAPEDERE